MCSTRRRSLILVLAAFFLIDYAPRSNGAPFYDLRNRVNLLHYDPHIIGGEITGIEKVPYQISIELLSMHMCGGVIISDAWVVTAGHCVHHQISGPTFMKWIRAGSTWVIPVVGTGGSIHKIVDAHIHPQFNTKAMDYDVGIIKVWNKFMFGPRVQSIPLPAGTEDDFLDYNQNAAISGWGATEILGIPAPSFVLKRVNISLLPKKNCSELLASYNIEVTPRMICGQPRGKGGPCVGDSGGPLIHKEKFIGVASFAVRQCNDPEKPVGFTSLLNREIYEYIKNKTGV